MKTVAELAKEINVSVQTIYRKLKSIKQDSDDNLKQDLTLKQNGVTYITEKGEHLIIKYLTGVEHDADKMFNDVKQVKHHNDNMFNSVEHDGDKMFNSVEHDGDKMFNSVKHFKQLENEELAFLRDQVKSLQDELQKEREHSREQSTRIADIAEQLAELSRNNQILLGKEQSKNDYTLIEQEQEKKTFFQRLFNK